MNEDNQVDITLTGFDTDNGTVVSFRIIDVGNLHGTLYDANHNPLDADSLVTPTSGGIFTVYFHPDQDFNGQATFSFAAIDDDGLEDLSPATATITVNPVNDAPTVVAPDAPILIDEDQSTAVTGLSVTDVDGGVLLVHLNATSTLTLATTNGLAGLVGNGTSSLTFTGTAAAINAALNGMLYSPTQDHSGQGSISYSFDDGTAAPVTGVVDVTITAINDAPVLASAIADQAIVEDTPWVFQVPAGAFTDVDSVLTFSATLANNAPLPLWLSFDAQTRTFSGTPPQDFNGQLDLKVAASDGQYAVSDTFALTIAPVNDAPTLSVPIADQSSLEDQPWTFQVPAGTFTDVDSALTFSATLANNAPLPSWLSFDAQTHTFSGTPPQNFYGPIDLKVTASDGQYSVSDTFTVDIGSVNDAPTVAGPASPASTSEDTPVAITGFSVADVEGDILTVHLTAPSVITLASITGLFGLTGNGTASVSFSGSVADINAALNGMSYQPTQDFSGVEHIAYSVSDGIPPAVTGSIQGECRCG